MVNSLMKEFKNKLKSNTTVRYIYYILKGFFDSEYKKKVVSIDSEAENEYYILNYGNENIGKTIFLYDENTNVNGFFAIYRFMIETCWFCEKHGFIPVFHIGDDSFYGNNGSLINGATDAYEQYFEQPAGIDYASALKSYSVINSTFVKRDMIRKEMIGRPINYLGYDVDESYLKLMAKYSDKYIRLNRNLEKRLMSDVNKVLKDKKVLGVHIRIKSFQAGINRHPVAGSLQEYLEETKEALSTGLFESVFLATVEPESIQAFKDEFGEKLICYTDVQRSEMGEAVFEKNKRENHKYLLGYEALRDMYTLSCCDGLVAGLSQVSFCARITKLKTNSDYIYKKIINHGIVDSNYTATDFAKSIK